MLHRFILLMCCAFGAGLSPHLSIAQTVLQPGDIVFTGINSTNADDFSFAPLVNLAAGTQIFFTDNGWMTTGGFRANEGVATYTVPNGGIVAGQLISFDQNPDFSATSQFLLSVEGDQLLAYQGSSASPVFIAALTARTSWSNATSANTSAVPPGLAIGASAVAVSTVNAYMSQAGQRRGPANSLRTWFNSASNWIGNNAARQTWRTISPFNENLYVEAGVVPDAEELQALQALYVSTAGDGWSLRTNWPSTPTPWPATLTSADFGTWYGVTVLNGDVSKLLLGNNHLVGNLPSEINKLAVIQEVQLASNQLRGALPSGIGALTQLNKLNLANNYFTGSIPMSWPQLPALYELNLSGNQLSGNIPLFTSYGVSGQSYKFIFSNNRFTGLVSYQGLPHHSQSTLDVSQNWLDFEDIEANVTQPVAGLIQHPFQQFLYVPQFCQPADTVAFVRQTTLRVTRQMAGIHNSTYQWERQLAGQWMSLSGQNNIQLQVSQIDEADQGYYRLAVTNSWLPGLTLYTKGFYADMVPYTPLPENRPVDQVVQTLSDADAIVSRGNATDPVNYVRTFSPQAALTDPTFIMQAPVAQVLVSTTYLDGLGRPVQTVQHQQSPGGRDIVVPHAYDALGRELKQYLPYVVSPTAEHYRPDALYEQYQFYRYPSAASAGVSPTGVAYGETVFEPSPLNRVVLQAQPGESWRKETGRVTTREERPNTALDSVQYFRPLATGSALGRQGAYTDNALWGVQGKDEHQYRTIEWKDGRGKIILKQVEANRIKNAQKQVFTRWLRTYYLYDDFGHLRVVLPPEAVKVLQVNNWQVTAAVERLLFRYRYDARGRVVGKQVPGTDGETEFVYDQLDRPILSQDAAQHGRDEWTFTKYDALSRPIYTGLGWSSTLTQATLQAGADAATSQFEQRTDVGGTPGYYTTRQAYPPLRDGVARPIGDPLNGVFDSYQVLTLTHYDDYNFDNDAQKVADVTFDTGAATALTVAPAVDTRVMGQVTRTRTRVLGVPSANPGAWLQTTTFYDEKARPIQIQSTNARGGQDVTTSQLDFAGKMQQSVTIHHGPNLSAAGVQVVEIHTYDAVGRLGAVNQQVPGETQAVPVSAITYNELGQLTRKTLSEGLLLQNVDYAYNPRGWLTKINDAALSNIADNDLFGLELCYEQGFTDSYAQYNGNLTGQKWRSRKDGIERAYGYVYDHINRLLQGDYVARATPYAPTSIWNAEASNYRLSFVSYDDNGNIKTLRRRGLLAEATPTTPKVYGPVDQLAYVYDGNRLRAVTDYVTTNELPRLAGYSGAPASLAGDFQEQNVRDNQEYFYDANGNLTKDLNKGITQILYNHLNLPRQIQFGTGADSVTFRYTANGMKVAKLVYQTGKPLQRTDYLGAFQYEQDSLRFFPHAEGRVLRFVSLVSGVRYEREFTIKDHLGNLRLAYRLGYTSTVTTSLEQSPTAIHDKETQQFEPNSVSPPVATNIGVTLARTGQYVAKLNAGGNSPQPLGPLRQVAVQKGDKVRLTAYGMYTTALPNSSFAFSLASFVASLLQQQPPQPSGPSEGLGQGQVLPLLSIGLLAGLPALSQLSGGVPKGYARLLVFDAQRNLVGVQCQVQQLTNQAFNNYQMLTLEVTADQDGYVTAYVGNESNGDVYFDDIEVQHLQGLQVQETHYDPWGASLVGLANTSPGLKQLNQYKYSSKELQSDLGLNWADHGARMYDMSLARWHNSDPLAEKYCGTTPYSYVAGNPLRCVDLNGMEITPINGGYQYTGQDAVDVGKLLKASSENASNNRHGSIGIITFGREKVFGNAMKFAVPEAIMANVSGAYGEGGIWDFMDAIKSISDQSPNGIGYLAVFSHGGEDLNQERETVGEGMIFASSRWDGNGKNVYTSDLHRIGDAVDAGLIKFAPFSLVYLGGCNVGTIYKSKAFPEGQSFALEFAKATRTSFVIGATDAHMEAKDHDDWRNTEFHAESCGTLMKYYWPSWSISGTVTPMDSPIIDVVKLAEQFRNGK
jgi:RHS repeat-associated protein